MWYASAEKKTLSKISKREYDNSDRVRFIQRLRRSFIFLVAFRTICQSMRCGALVDMALLPTPMRYAAYHLRPYAKKLGAFIHFFMYMHFGKEKDNEKLKKKKIPKTRMSGGKKIYIHQ